MKAISRKKETNKLWHITCRHCGTKWECSIDELCFVADPRDGDAFVLTCGDCKKENWVAANLLQVAAELKSAISSSNLSRES